MWIITDFEMHFLGANFIECYNPEKYPPIECYIPEKNPGKYPPKECNVVNVTSDGGRISEYHPQKLGKYLQTLVHTGSFHE